ncbi:MAG TPA: PEP-CTERM sorting domain-containing protein [Akkermansia muciniphila]|nr:PEP-CTERM sorting domain-containing protein [Akkermansia muciniphila]
MENQISFGNSWQTFISGPKGASLSLTISGLVAGASYQIALVTGCPFEGAGAWNSLVTSNTYDSAAPSIGANSQTIQARTPTGYTISDVIANEDGEIILTVNTPGSSHTPTFNALAISGETASVPEPATASLSLLGLVALMARRRRA